MTERGFSLLELLIACALLVAVGGALAAMAGPVRVLVERSLAGADLESGSRTALEVFVAELREAGSDPDVAPPDIRLAQLLPALWLTSDLDTSAFATPGGAVHITRTPFLGARAVLAAAALRGAAVLLLDTTSRCTGGPPACGFEPDTAAHLLGSSGAEAVTISSTGNGVVTLQQPLVSDFAAGSVLSTVSSVTYGSRPDGNGSSRLVRVTAGGAEQPVLDHVVEFTLAADTADVRRIRQVTVTIRLEAASAAFRGPAGYLFRRGGTASSARHWLPDRELRFVVALRNPPGAP